MENGKQVIPFTRSESEIEFALPSLLETHGKKHETKSPARSKAVRSFIHGAKNMQQESKALQVLELTPIQGSTVFQVGSENTEQEAKAVQVPEPTPMIKFHNSVVNAVDELVMNGPDPSEVKEVMLEAFEMGETFGLLHGQLTAEEAAIMDGFTDYVRDVVYKLSELNLIPQYIMDTVEAAVERALSENLQEEGSEEWA